MARDIVGTTPTAAIDGGNGTEGTDSSINFGVTLEETSAETVTVDETFTGTLSNASGADLDTSNAHRPERRGSGSVQFILRSPAR